MIDRAFCAAWESISTSFGNDLKAIEPARLQLAKAVLSVARGDSRNVEFLKRAALQAMALQISAADEEQGGEGWLLDRRPLGIGDVRGEPESREQ